MILYAIDDKKRTKGVFECNEEKARKLNADGYGIFFTPNSFNGARRAENIKKINYWYIDIDKCNKEDAFKKLLKSPALPTFIIETKNGYHVYWKAINATVDNFEDIEKRLIYKFNADPAVKDLPRLLRMPSYNHCKEEPFLINIVHKTEISYSEKQMMFAFKREPKKQYKPITTSDFRCVSPEKLLKPQYIHGGERNCKIFKKGIFLKRLGASEYETTELLRWLNQNISEPLEQSELETIIKRYSRWKA